MSPDKQRGQRREARPWPALCRSWPFKTHCCLPQHRTKWLCSSHRSYSKEGLAIIEGFSAQISVISPAMQSLFLGSGSGILQGSSLVVVCRVQPGVSRRVWGGLFRRVWGGTSWSVELLTWTPLVAALADLLPGALALLSGHSGSLTQPHPPLPASVTGLRAATPGSPGVPLAIC